MGQTEAVEGLDGMCVVLCDARLLGVSVAVGMDLEVNKSRWACTYIVAMDAMSISLHQLCPQIPSLVHVLPGYMCIGVGSTRMRCAKPGPFHDASGLRPRSALYILLWGPRPWVEGRKTGMERPLRR